MSARLLPTPSTVTSTFTEEISSLGGKLVDGAPRGLHRDLLNALFALRHRQDGLEPATLFLRSVLPDSVDVLPGDAVQHGVALRMHGPTIDLRCYLFRQVCSNGLIMARFVESRCIERVPEDAPFDAPDQTVVALRNAIAALAAVRPAAVAALQASTQARATLSLLRDLLREAAAARDLPRLRRTIDARLRAEADKSQWGFINAVTSTARDEPDPETRWRLEELGGFLAALALAGSRPRRASAELDQPACA